MTRKDQLYAAEQRQICDKVIAILDLDDRSSVWLGDLDEDEDKQARIIDLVEDIRRFFAFNNIPGAANPYTTKRAWLSIARGVTAPFYTWARTEEQRNKKRTSRFFLTLKSEISEVRSDPRKKNLKRSYTNGTTEKTPRSQSSGIQDDQEQSTSCAEEP